MQALNIKTASPCASSDLLPSSSDGSSYLPPLLLEEAVHAASYADATKVDASTARKRRDFDDRLFELRLNNDTAYRTVTRTIPEGTKPPRLVYSRKFWEGLESMAQYWDTSLDQYYEVAALPPATNGDVDKGPKRQRRDSPQPSHLTVPIRSSGSEQDAKLGSPTPEVSTSEEADVQNVASLTPLPPSDDTPTGREAVDGTPFEAGSPVPEPQACLKYKGRRTASGRDMPDQFRTDTIRAFVEVAVWPFQCTLAAPRQMPVVQMNKLNLPVRQTAAVYRVPKERSKARGGWHEGPIMCVQVRPEIDFESSSLSERERETKARLDMMRELGGLLQCAQERRRQGKTEVRPGEGKWWTTTPRWGGGQGGEVENHEGNSDSDVKDVLHLAEEATSSSKERAPRSRKKKTPAMLWKELKVGSRVWDAKTDYEAIGKDPSSGYDEVGSPHLPLFFY